ncbi:MAG: hypothetical protein Fur002_09010 [Anaerolineales bacterium]
MSNWIFDRFLRRFSVQARIIGSFMLIMLFAGAIAPVILYSLNSLVVRLEQVTNRDTKVERLLLQASRRVAISQLNLNRYIQDLTPSPFEALDDVNLALRDLQEARDLTSNEEQGQVIRLLIRNLEIYRQDISNLQKAHISKNEDEVARLESQLQKNSSDIGVRLDLLVSQNVKTVSAANDAVLSDARDSARAGLILIAVGFLLALSVSMLVSLSVTRPLKDLRSGAEAFQLTQQYTNIGESGKDEFTIIAGIFNSLTRQVSDLINSLEKRVTVRTNELNNAVRYIERRAKQFEAITKVARSVSVSTSLKELLPAITQVISEQFGFYHVGVFLNDESGQYAILAAANSEGGKRMLNRRHQLRVGEQGIVGYAVSAGKPRIALDVGQDVVFFNNPDLPETHSEMALPLIVSGKIIGALDIQSKESNAFSSEDVEALSALADQVSLAIQNARLFDQSRKTVAEAESIQRQYLRENWKRIPEEENFIGYRYSAVGATPLEVNADSATAAAPAVHVPVMLRGELIGTLSVQTPQHERLSADQMDLVKAIAERVALSAENARLFNETSRRAERERVVADISAKIGSSFQTQSILQTAAKELSELLEQADVIIKIEPPKSANTPAP